MTNGAMCFLATIFRKTDWYLVDIPFTSTKRFYSTFIIRSLWGLEQQEACSKPQAWNTFPAAVFGIITTWVSSRQE